MPSKLDILNQLKLGGIVAEHDELLNKCFIQHPVLYDLVHDQKDIVLGAKGAGKSALWKEIFDRQVEYPTLLNVRMWMVTNPSGDPEFREILAAIAKADQHSDEDELRVGWRLYFLAQFWRAAEPILPISVEKTKLTDDMQKYGITPSEVGGIKAGFAYAMAKARALKSLKVEWTKGVSLDFDEGQLSAGGTSAGIPFNDLFSRINKTLEQIDTRVWLILDRLDEIILSDESLENLVLKGLLLAYRDISDYPFARVKIFLRDDVYERVTSMGHFPALTHVKSRAAGPIKWELEDLLHLLVKRLVENIVIREYLYIDISAADAKSERRQVYYSLFPEKIDKGRAAEGFKWIVDRISDGRNVATPRDLLSVIEAARTFQREYYLREPADSAVQLVNEDSLRKSVRKVAKENLETRIYAEYPDLRKSIELFKNGKADHNNQTLRQLFGDEAENVAARLERIGFLYRRSRGGIDMWTIPFFYSYAIDATRGAAFDIPRGVAMEDEGE